MNRRHARSLILIAAASGVLTACSKPDPGMGETRKLIMGTFTEDSVTDRAGKAVAATISNTVPGIYVETWPSKGAYVSMDHLFDGTYDLVIVPAGRLWRHTREPERAKAKRRKNSARSRPVTRSSPPGHP